MWPVPVAGPTDQPFLFGPDAQRAVAVGVRDRVGRQLRFADSAVIRGSSSQHIAQSRTGAARWSRPAQPAAAKVLSLLGVDQAERPGNELAACDRRPTGTHEVGCRGWPGVAVA